MDSTPLAPSGTRDFQSPVDIGLRTFASMTPKYGGSFMRVFTVLTFFLKGPILILFLRKTKRNRVCLRIEQSQRRVNKGQPSLTIMALHLLVVSNFGGKIGYLFSSIYFTTKFIINFQLSSEFLYQSEPVKEYSSKQLVTLTNRIYLV